MIYMDKKDFKKTYTTLTLQLHGRTICRDFENFTYKYLKRHLSLEDEDAAYWFTVIIRKCFSNDRSEAMMNRINNGKYVIPTITANPRLGKISIGDKLKEGKNEYNFIRLINRLVKLYRINSYTVLDIAEELKYGDEKLLGIGGYSSDQLVKYMDEFNSNEYELQREYYYSDLM